MAFQRYGQHDQSYICDDIADLTSLPKANMGSTCYVIATAEKYMINSKGEWIFQMSYKNQGQENSGGSAPDMSAYATIVYSDAEDAKIMAYVDEQDEATLNNADSHLAEAIQNEDSELKGAVEYIVEEKVSEIENGTSWGDWPTE